MAGDSLEEKIGHMTARVDASDNNIAEIRVALHKINSRLNLIEKRLTTWSALLAFTKFLILVLVALLSFKLGDIKAAFYTVFGL